MGEDAGLFPEASSGRSPKDAISISPSKHQLDLKTLSGAFSKALRPLQKHLVESLAILERQSQRNRSD